MAPYAALCLSFAGTVPIFDAREYTDCVETAVRVGSFPGSYNCAGHPTAVWAWLVSSLLWMAPDKYWPLVVASVALGLAALWAFFDLLRALFPQSEIESALLTACLGAFPVVVSGTVDLNPDHGVLVFFLLALRAIVRERPRQAALFGLALVFTKEPGVLLYALATGLWALILVARREGTVPEKLRRLARAWPLSLPLAAFGGFMVFRSRGGVDPLWHNFGHVSLLDTFTTFRLLDQSFIGQLLGIFVLQFAWLATLLALPRWIRMAVRAALALGPGQPPALFYFDALLFAATLLLTRYQTFLNLRYYVAAYPLLLVCAFAGLRELSPARLPRLTTLGVLAVLFFASALRTVDPVSKAAMGTIRFGEHEMLDMTSLTHECCGHGRDQLCYNLEHLHLHPLENLLLDDLHARQSARVLASAALGEHHTVGRLDLKTWRRTLAHEDTVLPRVFIADDLDEGQRPPNVVFIRFFFVDNAPDEARIRRLYDEVGEKTYDIHGYRLTAVDYRLREPPGNPLAPRAVVR